MRPLAGDSTESVASEIAVTERGCCWEAGSFELARRAAANAAKTDIVGVKYAFFFLWRSIWFVIFIGRSVFLR